MDIADQSTTIDHLFAPEASEQGQATPSEQPAPPDLDSHQFQQHAPEAQPAATGQEQQQPQQQHQVPLSELIETRKRAQAAEEAARRAQQQLDQLNAEFRRFSQPQQPQPQQPQHVIDPVEDPQGFVNLVTQQIETRFLNNALNESERRARETHGSEAVDAAYEAAKQSGFAQAFTHKPDAYGEMVKWHKAQLLATQVGTDPAAYTEQLKATLRAQILAEMKQGTPPPQHLPPSLSSATRANSAPDVMGSDKDFFRQTMNPRRG